MFELISRPRRSEIDRVSREWTGLWDRFFGEWPSLIKEEAVWPALDVAEEKDNYIVTVELPGMEEKDIDVRVENDVLTICGEKKREHEEKEANYHRLERSYGSFSRSMWLPTGVEADKVKAVYKDGVLTVTVPKSTAAASRRIEVSKS